MGTMLRVAVWGLPEDSAAVALRAARAEVTRLDSLLSNYRADSDVSRVNEAAGSGAWIEIAPATAEALRLSLFYAARTEGAFDPTVGPLVDVWGFYREQGAMPSQSALDSARALVGWDDVEVEWYPGRVRLPRPGMALDFGAIGKGLAVDWALAAARGAGARSAMVDLGGNIGVSGEAPGGGDWPLGLRHPRNPATVFALIDVPDGSSIATSGDYERYFVHEGVRYAHIVDPRSGWPVQGVASVSVLAGSGSESDGLSTSLFVLGVDRGCAFLEGRQGVAAVWVRAPSGNDETLRVVVGGPESARIQVAEGIAVTHCPDRIR